MSWESLIVGVLGGFLMTLAFVTVRTRWPEQYVNPRSPAEQFPMKSLPNYLLFRLAPPYVGACLVAATLSRRGDPLVVGLVVYALVHVGLTNLRAMVTMLVHDPSQPGAARTSAFHLLMVLLVAGATALSYVTFDPLLPFIPSPEGLVLNLWTAAFAAMAIVATQNALRRDRPLAAPGSGARAAVGAHLWAYADDRAVAHDTDPQLVQAIVGAEAIERPGWIRTLERVKGRVHRPGTYGVAQMQSDHPISDEESVELLCRDLGGFWPERGSYGGVLRERLAARVELHNSNSSFVELAMNIYDDLVPHCRSSSEATAHDGRSVIEVTQIERRGQRIAISGTAIELHGRLRVLIPGHEAVVVPVSHAGPRRGDWTLAVPLEVHSVSIEPTSVAHQHVSSDEVVEVDLVHLY